MLIQVKRIQRRGQNSTLSEIHVDGVFCCYGLEATVRDRKIWGSTAIPKGRYKLGIRSMGAMHARYKRLFPDLHQGMIELLNVPDFKYVYLHIGNNFGDTAGCILVGQDVEWVEGDYELRKSKKAYKAIYARILELMAKGEVVIVIE